MIARRIAALVLLFAAALARADDTEVFVASQDDVSGAGRANILFIIDTSASMDSEVQTQVVWNPSTTFTGCYRSDAVYFGTGTQPPPCDSAAFVLKSSNRCEASAGGLATFGQYTGLVLGWDEAREHWDPLVEGDPERLLECEADRGIDGSGTSRYAANGAEGPWAATDANPPAWNTPYTLFDGNWLNWRTNPPTVSRTRLQIVQEVVTGIVANINDVNVGLIEFNREEGGWVSQAVTSVASSRNAMIAAVANMITQGRTPLSETLYEAALYLRGGRVDYGNVGPALSVPASRENGDPAGVRYASPITAECQKNFIVLLTDGEPLGDSTANAKIESLPGFPALIGSCDGTGEGRCLDDLAEYLNRTDASASVGGVQNVVTYTIGFGGVDTPLLEATARRGGGQYYLAEDTGSLTAVMSEVVGGIVERSGTFSAPTIPVSAFNLGSTERDVYVSVFQPAGTAHWPGNLKKYRLSGTQLVGQDGRVVIDAQTGLFQPDAFSFWSAEPDGGRVADGGAASQLPQTNDRRPFSDITAQVNGEPLDLSTEDNRIAVSNALLTSAMLGVTDEQREPLIRWIRGRDILDIDSDGDTIEPRYQMGDPLHVRPVTVNYGTSASAPDTVVFVSTNDGFLHAVDAATGIERWSFVPRRLLTRQNELLLNPPTEVKRYGLDGELRLFTGNDDDGRPRAILYFGMGRGGDAVFALDVTDRDRPQLLWQIDRGTRGYASIGQVWAAPVLARVNVGGTERRVVVLSGGYDDSQDNRGYNTDNIGNAVYIVDAFTGELVWSAGAPGAGHDLELETMQNSIPAAPRVVDLNGDGLADRMYVGDTGGRLFRFDIVNGDDAGHLGEGGLLATLGAADLVNPPASDIRRFYATPDVVLVNCLRGTFLAINVGSGFRGHPLDTDVQDEFFSVRDTNVFGTVASEDYGPPVRESELIDITGDPAAIVPRDARGWRLRLVESEGEKVLNPAITFSNTVFFTSFSPGGSVSACVGGLGVNRAYEVDVCNGNPLTNLDGSLESEPLSVDDRFRVLGQTGIAPESIFLFPSTLTEGPTRCIGLACFQLTPEEFGGGSRVHRTFWMQEPAR